MGTGDLSADDGCRIVFDVYDEDADDDGRPPVVLLHGFGADANINWVRPGVLDALIDDGRVVVTLDARGHGRSEKRTDATSYGPARMARDVEQLADHLALERYDLVGYSMGASVAAFVAAQDERVRRLVLGGVGAPVVDRAARAAQRERMKGLVDHLEAGDNDAVAEAVGGLFRAVASGDKEAAAALSAVMEANADALSIPAGLIDAPTLVLIGTDDPLAPDPQLLADAIPNATLRLVPGDHLGALSRRELTVELLAFLAD